MKSPHVVSTENSFVISLTVISEGILYPSLLGPLLH